MHADEVDTHVSLVRQLLAAQFPEWTELALKPVISAGTSNALYRLGSDMVVRLPRIPKASLQVQKEQQWLPKLAPHLPLAIPTPLAMGIPGEGYPWHWSVYRWLEGENKSIESLDDPQQAAIDLAQFITALHNIDPTGGPLPGEHNATRGLPLAMRDDHTRNLIDQLKDTFDADIMTKVWEAAVHATVWDKPSVWIHGDLMPGNILAINGKLSAIIDFGLLGTGDPASDVMTAWIFLSSKTRSIFHETLQADDATWLRARGWALWAGLVAYPYYKHTNPVLAAIAKRAINETVDDYNANG